MPGQSAIDWVGDDVPDGPRRDRMAGHQTADLIRVPAHYERFERVFLGENCWYAIRIAGGMSKKIKFIAACQSRPVSAITQHAPVDRIEPYGEGGKYKLVFSEPARPIGPIPFGDAPSGAIQGPRYTSFERLKAAKKVTDLVGTGLG